MNEIVKNLTRRDIDTMMASVEKADALATALFLVAQGDKLEFLDGDQVVTILDDVIYEIDQVKKSIQVDGK